MNLESAGWTHVGRRALNEDAWCARPDLGLFVVADGLGGYEGGEVASHCVVEAFVGFRERLVRDPGSTWPHRPQPGLGPEEDLLANGTAVAQRLLLARRTGHLEEMASTVVALAVGTRGAAVAHVGDSRLYRLRGGQLESLTRDHSLIEELRASGVPAPERGQAPYGHVITRALGTERAEPTLQRLVLSPGDVYVLCSDGLYEPLGPERLAAGLAQGSAVERAESLVCAAYAAGGKDNITAVVVRVLP